MNPFKAIYRVFAAYGFAVILFILLFLVILFGTLYQVDHGLFQAQKKYFSSVYVLHDLGPIVLPLPGGATLTALFALSLIAGTLRIKNKRKRIGVLTVHLGVLVMIASAAITYYFSDRGHMRLYPTEQSNEFASYYDWNIEVGKPAVGAKLHLIPDTQLLDLEGDKSRTFTSDELPFDITVNNYTINAVPQPVGPMMDVENPVVDGFTLFELEPENEAEINMPGAYVTVTDKETGDTTEGILWGMAVEPLTVRSGDVYYTLSLDRKRYPLPFTVRVDEFVRETHPNTPMDASFESYITKLEDGREEEYRIWMNHPLRHKGYTFFQASWGPPNARPGEPLFTVFEVVRNPADQGPLVACIIISIGFLLHFTQKLVGYMRTEARRRTA